ncbi:hypothetical protein [Pseudoduganella sp. OTU4001]|uniref:hypothetical protein n=1 Tax=Pseudoduganella sp. OTU4001 TaxID=3043854 RepID=UPI00313F3585
MNFDWIEVSPQDLLEVIAKQKPLTEDWAYIISGQYILEVIEATGLRPAPGLHDALAKRLMALVGNNHQVLAAWGESTTQPKH